MGLRLRYSVFGELLRRFGSGHVDVLRLLGNLCQDRDAVRQDLDEAEGYREIVFLLSYSIPQFADMERCQQRSVARQNAEVSLRSRELNFVHLLVHERAIGRDDLERELRGNCHTRPTLPSSSGPSR